MIVWPKTHNARQTDDGARAQQHLIHVESVNNINIRLLIN